MATLLLDYGGNQMALLGYCRVSSEQQHLDRQIVALKERGIPEENIYLDKLSGKNTARPGLQRLLATIQPGDTVMVESVSRFARNTRDLLELIDKLAAKGVDFVSQKEHIDTATPTGKFMLTVFAAVSELERSYILQRQAEGLAIAKAQGVHLGRTAAPLPENFDEDVALWQHGELSFQEMLKRCGMSKTTFYRRQQELRQQANVGES
jgi:DNA invertase Pin-like site-specific DNA recombinase